MAFATFDTRVSDVRGLSLTAEISIIAVSESPTALRVGTLKGGRYAQTADLCTASDRRCDHGSGAFAAKKANNIPKQFLDAILGDLRNAGVVHSRKGPGGGYSLARAASEIKIGHIIRTIDGPLAPLACASRTAYQPCHDCKEVKTCTIRLVMMRVRDAMSVASTRLFQNRVVERALRLQNMKIRSENDNYLFTPMFVVALFRSASYRSRCGADLRAS
jgi:Rrf2 family protein